MLTEPMERSPAVIVVVIYEVLVIVNCAVGPPARPLAVCERITEPATRYPTHDAVPAKVPAAVSIQHNLSAFAIEFRAVVLCEEFKEAPRERVAPAKLSVTVIAYMPEVLMVKNSPIFVVPGVPAVRVMSAPWLDNRVV